jgi:hypothetical protein
MKYAIVVLIALYIGVMIGNSMSLGSFSKGIEKTRRFIGSLSWLAFTIFIIYLFFSNMDTMMNPGKVNSIKELQMEIVKNPANVKLISLGAFFGIVGILSIILRIPFSEWTQVKIFGLFEGTRKVEEVKKIANEEAKKMNQMERVRLEVIEATSSKAFYSDLKEIINGDPAVISVNQDVFILIAELYKITLEQHFENIKNRFGVLFVSNHFLHTDAYENLTPLVKETVYYAFQNQANFQIMDKGKRSVIALKMKVLENDSEYFIIYFDIEGDELAFEEDDFIMFSIINKIINHYIKTVELELFQEDIEEDSRGVI